MNPAKAIACLAAILLAFGLAACGGDDEDTTTTAETTTEMTDTTGEETTGEDGTSGQGNGAESSTLNIEADPDGALEYTETDLSVAAGDVTVEFSNPASIQHDVAINNPAGEMIGKTEVITDSTATLELSDLEPGEYQYWCTVPGHLEAGMEGTLTVE